MRLRGPAGEPVVERTIRTPEVYGVLSELPFDLKSKVQPEFTVQPQWREDFYNRLQKANVKVDRPVWDGAEFRPR